MLPYHIIPEISCSCTPAVPIGGRPQLAAGFGGSRGFGTGFAIALRLGHVPHPVPATLKIIYAAAPGLRRGSHSFFSSNYGAIDPDFFLVSVNSSFNITILGLWYMIGVLLDY